MKATNATTTEKLYTESELQQGKMYVQISETAYMYGRYDNATRQFWKDAAGYFLEVETDHLFNDQYNTKQLRVLDSQVSRVVGDVRAQWCRNKYTGEMVKVGQEGANIEANAAKANKCIGCFWFRSQLVSTTKSAESTETESVETEVKQYAKKCTFNKSGREKYNCTHEAAANAGFEYFTPENTFFLKYPNGLPSLRKGQEQILSIHTNCPKIGAYYLECFPSLGYYRLNSARKHYNFKYDGDKFYIVNSIGNEQRKTLPVPDKIMKGVLKALNSYPLHPVKELQTL